MGIGGNRRLDNSNLRASNVYVSRGRLDELSASSAVELVRMTATNLCTSILTPL